MSNDNDLKLNLPSMHDQIFSLAAPLIDQLLPWSYAIKNVTVVHYLLPGNSLFAFKLGLVEFECSLIL